MPEVTIDVSPTFQSVGEALKLIRIGAVLQQVITRFAALVERESKRETPVDTGRLRASILRDIFTLGASIKPNVVYAGWIHEGKMTRLGHTVYLKGRGKAGTPPGGKPYMKLGLDRAMGDADKIIGEEFQKEIAIGLRSLA